MKASKFDRKYVAMSITKDDRGRRLIKGIEMLKEETDRSQAWLLRRAVEEYLNRQSKKFIAKLDSEMKKR